MAIATYQGCQVNLKISASCKYIYPVPELPKHVLTAKCSNL